MNPIKIADIAKYLEKIALALDQDDLDTKHDEERTITIPLFIPASIYEILEKDSNFVDDTEYTLTRNYEMNCGILWVKFNNISFQLIPIE